MQSLHRVEKSHCSTLHGCIVAGDFSTQSFNRVYILLTLYRHAAPLEMTAVVSRPNVISTAAKGSGEISLFYGTGCIGVGDFGAQSFNRVYMLLTPYRHAAPLEMTVTAGRSHVISTAAKRSGEISLLYAAWPHCVGDFSTQSFNRVYILLTPYRHAAPLEMTAAADRSPVIWISENCPE